MSGVHTHRSHAQHLWHRAKKKFFWWWVFEVEGPEDSGGDVEEQTKAAMDDTSVVHFVKVGDLHTVKRMVEAGK